MKINNNKPIKLLTLFLLVLLINLFSFQVFAQTVEPAAEPPDEPTTTLSPTPTTNPGNGNCYSGDLETIKYGVGESETGPFEICAGEGSVVNEVWIKTGVKKDDKILTFCILFAEDRNDGCYSVVGIGRSCATVTKVGKDSSSCKDISHIEVALGPVPGLTPTPTLTVAPTVMPTVTPTPNPTEAPEPTAEPTNEPEPTTKPEPTSEPENHEEESSVGGSVVSVSSSDNSAEEKPIEQVEQKRGQVLGASTLADTGSLETKIMFTIGLLGLSFVMIGAANEKKIK